MRTVLFLYCIASMHMLVPVSSPAAINRCTVKESRANILVLECRDVNTEFQAGTRVKIKTERKDNVRMKR